MLFCDIGNKCFKILSNINDARSLRTTEIIALGDLASGVVVVFNIIV